MRIYANNAVIENDIRESVAIEVTDGTITRISNGSLLDADVVVEGLLIPTFLDIHCHGGGGQNFSDASFENAIKVHSEHGTGAMLGSLVADSHENLKEQIKNLVPAIKRDHLIGIHLEGPYLSKSRSGAHNRNQLRNPSWSEVSELMDLSNGSVRMITIAPELENAIETISKATKNGIVVAIGHSDAELDEYKRAIDAGASLITHFTNAMPKLGNEIADSLLNNFDIKLELILDRVHVSDENTRKILEKAGDRIVCVTDSMSAAAMPDGEYQLGEMPVIVSDGIARTSENKLAGSTLTMDVAFLNLINNFGISPTEAVKMTATRAAEIISAKDFGAISVGKLAKFNQLKDGKILNVL